MSRRLILVSFLVAALALSACGSSGSGLSSFKSDFAKDRSQFLAIGTALKNDITNASRMTDAQVAKTFGELAARVKAQGDNLSTLDPPSKFKSKLDALVSGFMPTAADLEAISTNATKHNYTAVKAAAEQLVRDAAKVKSADDALTRALGLPLKAS